MKNKTIYESLQEYLKNTPKEKVIEDWNEFQHLDKEGITVKEFLENQKQTDEKGRPLTYWGGLEENKQETLEEISERIVLETFNETFSKYPRGGKLSNKTLIEVLKTFFRLGSEWQQEQDKKLYSEEEVHNIIESYQYNIENAPIHITYDKWFEQFKKQ